MSDEICFDIALFRSLSAELGEEDTIEVLRTFLADTANKMKGLEANCADRATTRREAHAIKSSAATFGFNRLSRLARELEPNAETMTAAKLQQTIHELQQAFETAARFARTNLLTGETGMAS